MSQTAGLPRLRYQKEADGIRKVMVVRAFVAGGTGVIGRRLVPQLVARGHQVTALSMTHAGARANRELGWKGQYPSWREGFKEELA
jgi:nucleoside-diphosphate-sugar epimerase